MLSVFRRETREVAFRWLSGSANLMVEELQAIGQAQPIEDTEVDALFRLIGDLSHAAATPIVLVLDQLDQMVEPAQIDELQRGFGAWAIGGGDWSFGWGAQDDANSIAAIPPCARQGYQLD